MGPHVVMPRRPPGASTWRISSSATTGSVKRCSACCEATTSNVASSKGKRVSSHACQWTMLVRSIRRAASSAAGDGSVPTTLPAGPTTWAARRAKIPVPQATSSTRPPRTTTSASIARSAKRRPKAGSKCWAWTVADASSS